MHRLKITQVDQSTLQSWCCHGNARFSAARSRVSSPASCWRAARPAARRRRPCPAAASRPTPVIGRRRLRTMRTQRPTSMLRRHLRFNKTHLVSECTRTLAHEEYRRVPPPPNISVQMSHSGRGSVLTLQASLGAGWLFGIGWILCIERVLLKPTGITVAVDSRHS